MSAPQTTLDVLVAARELVARPGGWTKGVLARSPDGYSCEITQPDAVCFCSVGAVHRANCGGDTPTFTLLALSRVRKASGADNLVDWNDAPCRTQAEVVAVFDMAVALERSAAVAS